MLLVDSYFGAEWIDVGFVPWNGQTIVKIKMSERGGARYSRVSPSPGKGAIAAYTLCQSNDPDFLSGNNVLSIPLSVITLPPGKNSAFDNSGLCNWMILIRFLCLDPIPTSYTI